MNIQMRVHVLRTFITHLLVHMHQKEKIALEIAVKIASVNGSLLCFQFVPSKPQISKFALDNSVSSCNNTGCTIRWTSSREKRTGSIVFMSSKFCTIENVHET